MILYPGNIKEAVMNRIVLLALLGALICGCASSPKVPNPFAPYRALEAAATAPAARKAYRIGTVKVNLQQAVVNNAFPDETGLQEVFTALLQKDMERLGLLAAPGEDALDVDFDINYQRVFVGEAFGFSKGWGSSEFDYSSRLQRNGVALADYRSQRYMVSKGLAGNLLKIGKHLTASAGPADEQSELAVYAAGMVERLPR